MSKQVRLIVSGVLLAWLAWHTDWSQVRQTFAQLRLELWLAALGLYVAAQFVSSLRWRILAVPLGFPQPLRQYVGFYFIGMYFNLLLPTSVGGDVIRAWYLDGGSGRRLAAFFSVFVDRASGLLVLLGLACLATLVCPIALPAWVLASVWGTAGCAVLGLACLPVVGRWTRRLERVRRLGQAARLYLGQPRLLISSTLLSLVVQAVNVFIVWLVGRAIGAPVPALYYWVVTPMVTLLTMLPFSLNGMGIREWGMTLFLAPLGIPSSTAVSLTFLWFAVFMAASLCGAAVYVFGSFPRPGGSNEVRSDDGPVGGDPDQGRMRQPKAAA